MATKFSQFNLENNPQNVTTELVGLNTVAGTNIKVPADFALLDALVDAPNQVNNDMLYISGGNVDLINPSQHPNIPVRQTLYAEWVNQNAGTPNQSYFNVSKNTLTNVPYNDEQANINTNSQGTGIVMQYNGLPGNTGNTTFEIANAGQYKIEVNLSFFDQNQQGMTVFAGIYRVAGGSIIKGLINEVATGFKNDINYFGQNSITCFDNDEIEIKIEFTGGVGNNPFPAIGTAAGSIATSILIERVGK